MSQPSRVTGVALCNTLGATTEEVRNKLHAGEGRLVASPFDLPFEASVGQVEAPLPELPEHLLPYSTRTTRIAAQLLNQLQGPLDGMRGRVAPKRVGVLLGTSTAGADVTETAYRDYLRTGALPESYDLFKQHTYGAVLHVVRDLSGAQGPAWVVSTACTSSAKPLASADRLLKAGVIDAAIVGGIDTLCRMTLQGFHSLEALSPKPCRPFAADRSGLNIGEGGAFLLIERGGTPLALLEGVGESSDAFHISAPHPKGEGAILAMRRALSLAGREATDVSHVNAHGTGTRLNDSAEAAAIEEVVGKEVPVVSTKSYTGHMLGAAGATEAAFAAIAVNEGWIPPSLRADPVAENIHIRITTECLTGGFKHVLSNSFAFGGNNVSLLMGAPQ